MFAKRAACASRDKRALCFHIALPVVFLVVALLVELIHPPRQPALVLDAHGLYNGHDTSSASSSSSPLPVEVLLSQWKSWPGQLFSNYTQLAQSVRSDAIGYVAGHEEILCSAAEGGIGCDVPLDEVLLRDLLNHSLTRTFALSLSGEYEDGSLASTVLHNASYPHSIAEGLSLLYNVVLRELLVMASGGPSSSSPIPTIRTINHPLPMSSHEDQLVGLFRRVISGIFILIPFTFIPSSFVSFIVQEKESGARHLQYMAGANVMAFWVASALWDLAAYLATEALAFVVFFSFNRVEYIGDVDLALATASLLFLYGLSSIPLTYALSFAFRTHGMAQSVVLCVNFLVGFLLVIAEQVLSGYNSTVGPSLDAAHVLRAIPAYALGEGMFTIAGRRLSVLLMPPGSPPQPSVFSFLVYSDTNGGFTGGIGTSLLYMGLMFVASTAALCLLELWSFARRSEKLHDDSASPRDATEKPSGIAGRDVSVMAEERRVTELRRLEGTFGVDENSLGDGIVLDHITRRFNPDILAVDDMSFIVERGETVALLGLNGSGKSTIVAMLAGHLKPSSGAAFVGGLNVLDPRCRGHVGLCPQSDALLPLVTCREHLVLYCRLRGVTEGAALDQHVDALLIDFGLEGLANVPAGELSFGNRRRLSVAIAMAGHTKVVLLDEPTAGMDPIARRRTCEAVRQRCAKTKQALLLTTHQLDEVDALADRVAILADGTLRCIGERQDLKTRFTQGSYTIQLTLEDACLDGDDSAVKAILRMLRSEEDIKEDGEDCWSAAITASRLCVVTVKNKPVSSICRSVASLQRQSLEVAPTVSASPGEGGGEYRVPRIAHFSVSQHSIEEVLLRLS